MDILTLAGLVVALILVIYAFLIYPLILFFKIIFGSEMSSRSKALFIISSLLLFPLPSYLYGGLVKRGIFSKIMLLLNALFLIGFALFYFTLGPLGFSDMISRLKSEYTNTPAPISLEKALNPEKPPRLENKDAQGKKEEAPRKEEAPEEAPVDNGPNTYGIRETNVFKSGENETAQ